MLKIYRNNLIIFTRRRFTDISKVIDNDNKQKLEKNYKLYSDNLQEKSDMLNQLNDVIHYLPRKYLILYLIIRL